MRPLHADLKNDLRTFEAAQEFREASKNKTGEPTSLAANQNKGKTGAFELTGFSFMLDSSTGSYS